MININQVALVGHIGKAPVLKKTSSGHSFCYLSVATSRIWKDKNSGERRKHTDWHNVKVWGQAAEICCQYLKKGQQVGIVGSLRCDMVEVKDATGKVVKTEFYRYVDARKVDFGYEPKGQGLAAPQPQAGVSQSNDSKMFALFQAFMKAVNSQQDLVAPAPAPVGVIESTNPFDEDIPDHPDVEYMHAPVNESNVAKAAAPRTLVAGL